MYTPSHFSETRLEQLHRIMRDHPLGILVTTGESGLDADHIPFEFDAQSGTHGCLRAHVARENDVWKRAPSGTDVLVIFRGVESYISPNWYPSKHETHRQVPTWNYEVVHARGVMTVHDDERYLRGLLARLTRTHEVIEPKPWKMGEAPADYIADMLTKVVGIEIRITSLTGKRKLSQNKDEQDRLNAAATLAERGKIELAAFMKKPD